MTLLDPARSDSPTATALVAALVAVHGGESLGEALEAIDRQVYEPEAVIVVGGNAEIREESGESKWAASLAEAVAGLEPSITHVWLLHDDSIPRPDALAALVREGGRVGADLVGSKILRSGRPGVLESVGFATDVFEVPASGLDTDELDQEQYDVLRDVAFVAGSSILVDRDMLERVGGLDRRLEPIMAALDLCQRVRLAGGRVVVVPSAEVLHDGTCAGRSKRWRVEAGRLRAMLKAYSPVTLVWVVPFNLGLGLLEAVISPLVGKWRLFAFLRAWLWNLVWLPSTIGARRRVERVVGDAELFRFQVRGSARLNSLWERTADLVGRFTASEQARSLGHLVDSGGETVRRPVVASVLAGVGFALFATRQLWVDGVTTVGYALAPPSSVASALRAVAGGWNPAGLGSAEPLRPVHGMVSLVQVAVFGRASLALTLIMVAAAVAGVVGIARLLGPFGVRPAARYAAGVLFIGGPVVRVLAADGVWHGIVAMALLPWILAVVLHRRRTASAVASAALLTAMAAAFAPLVVGLPLAMMLIWALVDSDDRLLSARRAAAGALLALPALLPWLAAIDDAGFVLTSGPDFFWSPTWWIVGVSAITALTVLAAAPEAVGKLCGWGVLVLTGGAVLARSGSFGWGTDPGIAGMAAVGVGLAAVAGAAFETGARAFAVSAPGRYARLLAGLLAALLVAGSLTLALPGRFGFPEAGLEETLSFTAQTTPGRALLLGDENMMPGGGHSLPGGIHYRVVSTPVPRLWEAWPTPELAGDVALTSALAKALSGGDFRLGEALAPFGIQWIITTGSRPLDAALDAQLDLMPLALPRTSAYRVEVPAPRAVDDSGREWVSTGTGYVGPAGGGTVRLAENGDTRWGEIWEQDGWANRVTVPGPLIEFGPIRQLRVAAFVALVWAGLLVLGSAAIRERGS